MKIYLKSLILFAICVFTGSFFAQIDFNNYATLMSKGKIPKDFTEQTYAKLEEDLKNGRDELKKSQEKVFLEGTNYAIDEILHSGLVVYGDEISTYVTDVADKLLKSNNVLRSKLRFYTIKSNSANAFSTDQGIVFVTTGLIAQLTSEAQLAFILAHEISHYTEKHVVMTYDWKTKNHRHNDRIEKLSQYSKEKEFEADKIGVELYNEAGYSADEIISTFDVLMYSYLPFDEIEFPVTYYNSNLLFVPTDFFPTKKYEIKAVEDYDDLNSTHPNIKKRKEAVQLEIGIYSNWGEATHFFGEDRFNEIRNIARFESVRSDVIDANYGDALYSIFMLERDFPESMYLKRMKAQVWLNIMLYKTENISTKTIAKTSELEGESAALHFFLKKLSRDGMITLALRQIYDLHSASPEDEELNAIYTKFIKDLTNDEKFKTETFSKKTFQEAADDFIKSKNDTTKAILKDTIAKKSESKYDRIKNKKNVDSPENFDSTKFYLYGLTDILSDSSFLGLHSKYKSIVNDKKQETERYEALSKKEKSAYDRKLIENQYSMGIKEVIVVEPMVYSYKNGNINNVKSEKLAQDFSGVIEESAALVGVTVYEIDSHSLLEKGTQSYNERSILISMLSQISQEDKVNIFPVDYQLLKSIKSDYGTSKVMFSLVEHEYSPNITAAGIFSSLFVYPVLFLYVPIGLFTGNNTEISVLILDLDNGIIENGINYYIKDSPKKLQLGAHMCDIFKKLSTEPKN